MSSVHRVKDPAANADISQLTFSLNVVFSLYATSRTSTYMVLLRLDLHYIPWLHGHYHIFSLGRLRECKASEEA